MKDCLFCKIVNKEIHSNIIFEDDHMMAFKDINPQTPSHILLIPKAHFASLNDVTEDNKDILSHILIKARKIAMDIGALENGYRIVLNTGKDAGQEVFHIHFHLLSGRRMSWPPG